MPNCSTVFLWLLRHKEFSEQYTRAREAGMDAMAEEILDIAEEKPMATITFGENGIKECVDNAGIQRNRLRVDTRKWLMSKLAPKKYGDKLVHEGNADAPLVVEHIGRK